MPYLPLVIMDTCGELDVFRTPETMSNWLEAVDVRDGEYRVFDCAGVEYEVWAASDSSPVMLGPMIGHETELVLHFARHFVDLARRRGDTTSSLELVSAEDVQRALIPYAR